MKITTQQIQNIIKEELDKLLHEQDNNDVVLRTALKEIVDDHFAEQFDPTVEKRIKTIIVNKIFPAIKDQAVVDTFKKLDFENNPKSVLELSLAFHNEFAPEDKAIIRALVDYPLGNIEDKGKKKEKVIDYLVKTKDLAKLDFGGKNLSGVDLSGANLRDAQLTETILSEADLRGAKLFRANLIDANLGNADLSGADLDGVKYSDQTQWPQGFDPEAAGTEKI